MSLAESLLDALRREAAAASNRGDTHRAAELMAQVKWYAHASGVSK